MICLDSTDLPSLDIEAAMRDPFGVLWIPRDEILLGDKSEVLHLALSASAEV
jgi:hypothetical protein